MSVCLLGPPAQARAREAITGVAEPATGHFLNFSARFTVTMTRVADNRPVPNIPIRFRTSASDQFLCDATTNREGKATCVASFIGNILQPLDGFVAGYDAIFDGNARYQPTRVHSTATPAP